MSGDFGALSSGGSAGEGNLEVFLSQPVTSEAACIARLGLLGALWSRLEADLNDRRHAWCRGQVRRKYCRAVSGRGNRSIVAGVMGRMVSATVHFAARFGEWL